MDWVEIIVPAAAAEVDEVAALLADSEPFRGRRIGIVITDCCALPKAAWTSLPNSRLNIWSVPPSSTSASTATESYPWRIG